MTLTNLLIPTYMQMLAALSGWLEKARAERGDAAVALLAAAYLACAEGIKRRAMRHG